MIIIVIGIGIVVASRLCRIRIHVVVNVLGHFVLGGKASPTVGHWAAEGTIALAIGEVLWMRIANRKRI